MSVALQAVEILAQEETTFKGLGAVGYGLAAIGPGVASASSSVRRSRHGSPAEMAGQLRTTMFLGIAFTEPSR